MGKVCHDDRPSDSSLVIVVIRKIVKFNALGVVSAAEQPFKSACHEQEIRSVQAATPGNAWWVKANIQTKPRKQICQSVSRVQVDSLLTAIFEHGETTNVYKYNIEP
jgi:hypothetical protein